MSRKPPIVDYHNRRPDSDPRFQLRRLCDIAAGCCFVAAVYFALLSIVVSAKFATKTPEYVQFEKKVRAEATTRPVDTTIELHDFKGQAYVRRPVFSLWSTYFALALAGAGVSMMLFRYRKSQ